MNPKKAVVYYNGKIAGFLRKEDDRYFFHYSKEYLSDGNNPAVSLTLPKTEEEYVSDYLFPFFYGLLAEGDNKQLQCRTLLIDENDHFTRLLKTTENDTIGGVTVREEE